MIPVITAGFPFPSRSVPRFLVIEYVCRQIADVLQYRPDHYRAVSYPDKFDVELPPCPLPSRPWPRFLVNEQVCRQITAVSHSHPDHCRGAPLPSRFTVKITDVFYYHPGQYRRVSLWNKFRVKLPTFSIAVSTIARTVVFSRLSSNYRRIAAITVELLRLPSFYLEHRRITAFTVDSRHYRRFSVPLPIITEVPRCRIRLPSSC